MRRVKKTKLALKLLLVVIIFIGAVMRFYKLDWGDGYFFHPDEYHIRAAVEQLSFPKQMNPHFFAYGSFIVYLIYFTSLLFKGVNLILVGRFYSALFSSLTIYLFYLIAKIVFKREKFNYSLLAVFLAAILPGLVQQAHFTTPESILTFWLFLSFYLCLKWLEKRKNSLFWLAAVSFGLAVVTKISALLYLPVLLLLPFLSGGRFVKNRLRDNVTVFLRQILMGLFAMVIVLFVFLLISPYAVFDWKDFVNTMQYEVGVGRGSLQVFYTRQFINSIPVVFHLRYVFPYVLGPAVLFFGIFGFLVVLIEELLFLASFVSKKKIKVDRVWRFQLLVLLLIFVSGFFSTAFMFAKWVRFMMPVYGFFILFAIYFLQWLVRGRRNLWVRKLVLSALSLLLLVVTVGWGLAFFSIYTKKDIRVEVTGWVKRNLPKKSFILTEAGNMLEVPLSGDYRKKSFDFYNLEENKVLQGELPELLARADYFVVQSRRIFVNHRRLRGSFPITARFYDLLFSGGLGFEKIKSFSPYVGFSDERAEETWSVFDHPVVRIYKKVKLLSRDDYEKILGL